MSICYKYKYLTFLIICLIQVERDLDAVLRADGGRGRRWCAALRGGGRGDAHRAVPGAPPIAAHLAQEEEPVVSRTPDNSSISCSKSSAVAWKGPQPYTTSQLNNLAIYEGKHLLSAKPYIFCRHSVIKNLI